MRSPDSRQAFISRGNSKLNRETAKERTEMVNKRLESIDIPKY